MNKTIGNNLKRLRDANHFTQEQLAVFLGINRSTYSNYEMGEREIPFIILEKAADLFGLDLHLFFEEDESVVDNMLVCSFRVDDLTPSDMAEVASFKNIVKNYLKINTLLYE